MVLSSDCATIANGLKAGDLVAYPCEGLWGLGCDPRSPQALHRLLQVKGRDEAKGLILVAGQLQQLRPFVAPGHSWDQAQSFWPDAVTCLVAAAADCPRMLTGRHRNIAVRLSAHEPVIALCNAFGGALTSTSANPAGATPCRHLDEVQALWQDEVDWLYDAPLGSLGGPTPIVDAASGEWLRQ